MENKYIVSIVIIGTFFILTGLLIWKNYRKYKANKQIQYERDQAELKEREKLDKEFSSLEGRFND